MSRSCRPLWSALRVGSDAMIADMIEPGRRAGAYALLRMINNLGIAIGPAIGGFVAGVSYSLAFAIAAAASLLFVSLIILKVPETLPTGAAARANHSGAGGPAHFSATCCTHEMAVLGVTSSVMLVQGPPSMGVAVNG